MATQVQKTGVWNQFNQSDCLLSIRLFVVKQTRQILRLGYCKDLPNSQMIGRILDQSFSLSFSKSQCQHLFKTYERSKYQWAIKIPMSNQNTNRCSPTRFIIPTANNTNKKMIKGEGMMSRCLKYNKTYKLVSHIKFLKHVYF